MFYRWGNGTVNLRSTEGCILYLFRGFITHIVTLKALRSSAGKKILILFNSDFPVLFDDQPNISQSLNNGALKVFFIIKWSSVRFQTLSHKAQFSLQTLFISLIFMGIVLGTKNTMIIHKILIIIIIVAKTRVLTSC